MARATQSAPKPAAQTAASPLDALQAPAQTLDDAQRQHLCQRWLAASTQHLRWRLVVATQLRQARAAGLTEEEATLSVETAQLEADERAEAVQRLTREASLCGVLLPVLALREQEQLDDVDMDILLLCVAPHTDVDLRDAIARFNDNLLANYVDVRLCLEFLAQDPVERLALRARFLPSGRLRRARLVQLQPPRESSDNLLGAEVLPAQRVLQLLLGETGLLDTAMAGLARVVRPKVELDQVVVPAEVLTPLQTLLRSARDRRSTPGSAHAVGLPSSLVVEVSGPPGSGKSLLVHALAADLGLAVVELDAQRLHDAADTELERNVHGLLDQARLLGALAVLDGCDALLAKGSAKVDLVQQALAAHTGLVVLTSRDSSQLDPNLDRFVVHRLQLDTPDAPSRARILRQHLPDGVVFGPDCDVSALAGQYQFPGALLRNAMQVAVNRAWAARPDQPVIDHAMLQKACHDQIRASLDEYAVRRKVSLSLQDLIVPKETLEDIEEMFVAARQRAHVLHNWGFGQKLSTGKGLIALFSGEPGVGKTLCATILANELDQQLFQISIPRVVSKWIGETEQNIEQIFATAKASHGILLFDEADSLFAGRTKVESSVDRYSNMATNMLLQEIENFDGVVILTTNLEKNIDKAFQRRIGFKVHFPFPEASLRARIWQTLVPSACPVDPDLDWDELGERFELSGGHIKNAVLRGAYQAAEEGVVLNMRHLEFAARQECKNAGKVFRSSDHGAAY